MKRFLSLALSTSLLASSALAQVPTFAKPAQDNPAPVVRIVPGSPPAPQSATPAPVDPATVVAQAAKPLPALKLDARQIPLGGALKSPEVWAAYKTRFVTDQGRVVDTANNLISHSEGQGYGMLFAVAANDRHAFERIWGWTRANLMVRDDQLVAWRWEPNMRPAVGDMNNATDGDILIAWALAEAAELWNDTSYRIAGRRIAVEMGRKTIVNKTKYGSIILPAVSGFATEDRKDGPVVNISYWVFPALSRLWIVAPEFDWSGISQSGLDLLKNAKFGPAGLPTEWVSAKETTLKPADGFPQQFGYNSIRIPLYMAWAGIGEREHYAPYAAMWARSTALAVVDTASGRSVQPMSESGYSTIASLTLCVTDSKPLSRDFMSGRSAENYYPATLQLIALLAAQMRYTSCLRG